MYNFFRHPNPLDCRPSNRIQGSAKTGLRPGGGPGINCYRAIRNQGQIGPNVIGTTDIRNTLRVSLTNIQ